MKTFAYRCKRPTGETEAGQLACEGVGAAKRQLFSRGLFIVSVEEVTEREPLWRGLLLQRVGVKDLAALSRQLERLLRAGLSLTGAFHTLGEQPPSPALPKVLAGVEERLREGAPLCAALEAYPKVFPTLYVNMVRAGEAGGTLEETLGRLADYLDKQVENRSRILNAMIYPASMLVVGAITVFVLTAFVLPRFTLVFEQMEQDLPWITTMVVEFSRFMAAYWWALAAGVLAAMAIWSRYVRTASGRNMRDRWALKLPVLGGIIKEGEISTLTRTLGTLLESGVTMLSAIQTAGDTVGNTIFKEFAVSAHARVKDGEPLSAQMKASPLFPPMVANVIAVAEKSGMLEEALKETAEDCDEEVGKKVKVLLTLMEPALIVLMGGFVGVIVAAMLLPIFTLEEMMQ